MKKFLFATAIGLLLTACGSFGTAGSSASPIPQLAVTEKDHTATVRVGQKLEIALHAASGLNDWTHPKSSDETILAPAVDPAATAARGVTLAAFEARSTGEAEVTATASPLCSPGQACPMYLAVYSLKVSVTP
jgi:hypothetical protein